MGYRSAYTYAEAKEYLALYKDAERSLIIGQVKGYKIGTREVTLLDLEEIEREIQKFSNIIESYEQNKRTARNVAVVFRDT